MKNSIHQKLFNIKGKIGKISKDSQNPFFNSKYFDINELLEHLEPLLREENLLLLQPCENGKVASRIIDLETGESVESSLELPALNDPQKIGSCVTYYRRYTLGSLLSIQAEDDDANKAAGNTSQPKKAEDNRPWLSDNQLKKALERINSGEAGVYEKIDKAFRMKKDYRAQLKNNLQTA